MFSHVLSILYVQIQVICQKLGITENNDLDIKFSFFLLVLNIYYIFCMTFF